MKTLEAVALTKRFGSRTLWRDISFSLEPGESLAITGASGSGKSTLLNCVGLLEDPTSGEVVIGGIQDLGAAGITRRRRIRRDLLGYVFQNYALVENATVDYNLGIAASRVPRRDRRTAMEFALARVGLEKRGDAKVYELSGGEQQRLAIARLVVKKPAVILADEPTAALDTENAEHVMSLLHEFTQQGCVLIVATHSAQLAERCDEVLHLKETPAVTPDSAERTHG